MSTDKSNESSSDRRNFLKETVSGVAALAAAAQTLSAQQSNSSTSEANPSTSGANEPVTKEPSGITSLTVERSGSDFMVDILKALGIEYIAANPGSSFRGLQESVINYGGNKTPEFLTCCHEESSVGMAHGYAKIAGKPMGVLAHGTVGLQHASMAIYNAFCDRVPVFIIVGNTLDATRRKPGPEWRHSVQDAADMVREYIKWDDTPNSLTHFAESAVRAYKIGMTAPTAPVLLVADSELQEMPIEKNSDLRIPKITLTSPPQGDTDAVLEAARLLVAAETPVLIADRLAHTPAGMQHLIELAEALQAPVIDQGGRMNFPTRHFLNQSGRTRSLVGGADVILGLELTDFWGTVNAFHDQLQRTSKSLTKPSAKLISINSDDLYTKSNYQSFQRFPQVDQAIAADGEATLPALIEAVKRLTTADRKRVFEERGRTLAAAHEAMLERARTEATYAWDASPVSLARLHAELWAQIKNKDWSMVSPGREWPVRLWDIDKHYQYIGGSGGGGVGYTAPASVGAALANRKYGRLSINIQPDGDMMYAPGVLWTATHHRIPLLTIMYNNRGYHQEVMHIQRLGNRHNRGITNAHIGTTLTDPNIDYAKIAEGMGMHGEGPITDPADLAPAFRRAIAIVERGEPAMVDVVTQPR
jgi:acetolactate synthase-1/2/3 large subunit